ncbi:replicase large subunit [Striga asiatica]|uniref:Replicase large subunit n=1 Tax=Striga asiatica TaxID=4170 RepID=A0A5A7QD52_STRAF|nr:replicase large subunit [Striga asiatica]
MLSPEDVAWADSCLSKDIIMPSPEDVAWADSCLSKDSDVLDNDWNLNALKEALLETSTPQNKPSLNENTDDFWSSHKVEDIFLPTYNENSRDLGLSDDETGFVFQTNELDQPAKDIFKVWDLDLPPEEDDDDLVKQLNKALGENSLDSRSSTSDDNVTKAWKDLPGKSLDDLISGIADLALNPSSG